jgi:uncharacterized protein YoxC
MADELQAMVARIDERTEHMQEDIAEVKETCKCLTKTVNDHSEKLSVIKERLNGASNCQSLTKKQKASAGGAIVAFVAAVIVAITEWFKGH